VLKTIPKQANQTWKVFFLCGLLFVNFGCKDQPSQKFRIEETYVPEILTFCEDTIPISDPDIRERLEKELIINTYWESNTIQWYKKSCYFNQWKYWNRIWL
jgi:hypothetical protein